MKRMKMKDMLNELDREIIAVSKLKTASFNDQDLNSFFSLCSRLDGLLYAYALLTGSETLACYQTGLSQNSNGAKYTSGLVE